MIRRAKHIIKEIVRKVFRIYPEFKFIPAKGITCQRIDFMFRGHSVIIESDYSTPLYETIAEIADYDCYQLDQLHFDKSGASVIVDIGANIGVTAMVFSKISSGKIYCYEPIKRNCEFIKRNKKHNNAQNVEIIEKAVADKTGTITFQVEEDVSVSAHAASLALNNLTNAETIEVPAISIRELIQNLSGTSIDLMKIDCEGGEYPILEVLDKESARHIKALTFEVHDLDHVRNVQLVENRLVSLGFTIYKKREMFDRRNLHHILAVKPTA